MKKVVKFGGSSLADAGQFRKVAAIVLEEESRRYVVPSAPGKRYSNDDKVTDLLIACHKAAQEGGDWQPIWEKIKDRYRSIASELALAATLKHEFEEIEEHLQSGCSLDYMASRGEYLNGILLAQFLGYEFLDQEGKEVPLGARGLEYLASIRDEKVHPQLRECEFRVACDVVNPLCGPQGSSAIYGPQKGADAEMIDKMDKWLGAYAKLAAETFPKADPETPGTGAAGGGLHRPDRGRAAAYGPRAFFPFL